MVRVMARNEVGISDPLEPEEPVKVIRPEGRWRYSSSVNSIKNHDVIKALINF